MVAPILNAVSKGFSSKQIIDYLIRQFPQHADKIRNAIALGITPDRIIQFVAGGREMINGASAPLEQTHSQPRQMTEHEQTRQQDVQNKQQVYNQIGTGLAAGGSLLGGMALSRALPAIAQQVAPNLLGKGVGSPPNAQQPQQPGNTQQAQQPLPQEAQVAPIASQGLPSEKIIDDMGLKDRIETMTRAGNPPDVIAAALDKIITPGQKKWLKSQTQEPLEKIVADYIATRPKQPEPAKEVAPQEEIKEKPSEPVIEKETAPKVQKVARTAILPDGRIGELESIKNGVANIKIDGIIKRRPESSIEDVDMPEKDLADLYSDLLKGIEKHTGKQISRNVEWAGYDAEKQKLAYRPHGTDKAYTYDLEPEDIEELKQIKLRKSTGENFVGAWEAGTESPIGAAMYALIKKLQARHGGKGKEYTAKYETLYEATGPAKEALKKKKKDEEKEKRKKAKK